MTSWHRFNECEGNGSHIFSYASSHADFKYLFNNTMACNARVSMRALFSKYHAFDALNSLVGVAGGTGSAFSVIVRAYLSIIGINYDVPHVVVTAPNLPAS